MTHRIFFSLITLFVFAAGLDAAMVRVVGVADGQTLIVDRGGVAVNVKLAGITITDDAGARALMKWTLGSSWILLEPQPGGGHYVYRSPDAMFINRELVARGFAKATSPQIEPPSNVIVTYLGTLRATAVAPVRTPAASGTGSARTPRNPARPSPPRRRRKP